MGWTFGFGFTRKDVIREATENWKNPKGGSGTVLRHCCRGNVIYILWEITGSEGLKERFIEVVLMKRSPEGWGYKQMDESMGPYYYECPISYIEMAGPTKYESAQKWRDQVWARHLAKQMNKTRYKIYGRNYSLETAISVNPKETK